jgi:capsular polysaccharide biosynthesis protein
LIRSTAVTGRQLDRYLIVLKSLQVAEAAVHRLPGPQPPDKASLLKASSELDRQIVVGLDRNESTLEVTARASSPGQAAIVANAVAGGLLQVRGAEAQNIAGTAVTEALEQVSHLSRNTEKRNAEVSALRKRLAPILAERQVQVVQPAEPSSAPLLAVGVTTAIAFVTILALLMLMGVWRPRHDSAET